MKVDIVEKENPELSDPIIICGLPGSALVGKLAVDHLVEELSAQQLAEIYLDGMAPQVFVENNGTVSALNNDILFWKSNMNGVPDLIFYTADAQPATPESEYQLSSTVLDYLSQKYSASRIITLGAFVTGTFTQSPRVYAAATQESLIKEASSKGCEVMNGGSITGMNGIILGIAKLKGIRGYSLLGETSGYAIDPKASEALLVILEKLIGVKVDLAELQERAKEAQSVFQTVEALRRQQQAQQSGESADLQQQDQSEQSEDDKKKLGYIS